MGALRAPYALHRLHLQLTSPYPGCWAPYFPVEFRHDASRRQSAEGYLYPKPVDFRKSINGLAALVELDIKVEVFNPVLFVFLNRTRSQVKILYWERNGFCLWLKRLEAERFKTKPDAGDEAIELTVDELNWLLDGIDLWRNRPHQILTPRFVT
ncbi:IS66 Orf2 family protein [Ectopseudomonas oleovorans]|uniref:IS66 Orf2 family protein n=7 Tax=Pseudomonadaceae TaxID=135621 RepID=A0A379K4R8_ECTOL|nr:IS66 Orf2 family protein [Pseudomonas oleovorans]